MLKEYINTHPKDLGAYNDYFDYLRNKADETSLKEVKAETEWLRNTAQRQFNELKGFFPTDAVKFAELIRKSFLFLAPEDLHSFLIYNEWNRPPEERFYQPRMRVLYKWVKAIQKLVDDELDELYLSCPPRVGKTTFLMMVICWVMGRKPNGTNLYSAYSDIITSAFYNGVLEVLGDTSGIYLWNEVFNKCTIASTSAKEETIHINKKRHYPTLTSRSLYGTLNGACDVNNILIADDLIGGIEEAMNKDRLDNAWYKVDNNLIPRCKQNGKIIFCGTRWSIYDPVGRRLDLIQKNENFRDRRIEVINIPAVNSKGESNFEYDYGVGFSGQFYAMRRASFEHNNDLASWQAQYMGEPIERTGVLFEPSEMRYYNGELPEEGLIRVFMAVDPAFGGGDFTSAPVIYQYENGNCYVHDVVFNNGRKEITQPLVVDCVIQNKVGTLQFEVSKATSSYKEKIEELLKAEGYRCHIQSKFAPVNKSKEVKIYERQGEIRDLYFRENGKRSKEYEMFMQNMFSFKLEGKNKHDDSVDSLAIAVDMIFGANDNKVTVGKRCF